MRRLLVLIFILVLSAEAFADEFDNFRLVIDNYRDYSLENRDNTIQELMSHDGNDIEKHYLLGMLYTIQGIETMTMVAKSKPSKPKVAEVLTDPAVSEYFINAEKQYNEVDNRQSGYKYIYCKYAELYRYSFNGNGLVSITKKIGTIEQTESIQSCKKAITDIAIDYAQYGQVETSRAIFLAAINNWAPYPKFMLEAMGDLSDVLGDTKSAKEWWQRCARETYDQDKERCQQKAMK